MTSKTSDQAGLKADLLSKADSLVSQQKLREAIAAFKQLMGQERRPEWVQSLVACYDARGRELLKKGLYNEALILGENAFEYPEGLTQIVGMTYLQCMIKAGKIGKAAKFYNEHYGMLEKHPDARTVETRFAAGLLLNDSELLKIFVPSTSLRQHTELARQALTAYCAGEDAKMEAALKDIPFRSPFRDFSLLLKALVILPQNPALAHDIFKKIPSESAFFGMADRLVATTFDGDAPARHIAKASPEYRALTAELKGWNKQQIQLAHDIGKLSGNVSESETLNFLCAQKSASPGPTEQKLRSAGKALLVEYPKGMKVFERRFGKMNVFEKAHVQALAAEKERDIKDLINHWTECNNVAAGTLDGVETSVLLKHIATLLAQARAAGLRASPPPETILKQAILRDPDDLSSFLELMKLQTENDFDKDYQETLDAALQHFPGNRDILIQAITASQKKKAFKKAAGYAKKLLDLDPINRVARKSLVNCHLEHARKQILKKKTDLTLKEIALAQGYSQDADDQMEIAVVTGWHAFLQANEEEYQAAFETVRKLAPHPLVADLVLFTEGLRQRVPKPKVIKTIGALSAVPLSGGRAVQAYCKRLRACYQAAPKEVGVVMASCRAVLAKATADLHEKNDFVVLCESLHAIRADYVLHDFAAVALKKFPEQPLFVFYVIFAKNRGDIRNLTVEQVQTLQRLASNDTMKSDQRAYVLIDDYLHEYFDWLGPINPFGWDDDDDDYEEDDFDEYDDDPPLNILLEMVNQLKGSMPKQEYDRLVKMLESSDPKAQDALAQLLDELVNHGGVISPKELLHENSLRTTGCSRNGKRRRHQKGLSAQDSTIST